VASSKQADEQTIQAIEACFHERCRARQVTGEFAVAVGPIARRICERARWADLVVISLAHPPQPSPIAKLSSGLRTLIRRCETPILTVPGNASPIERLLLAYDGSPKAKEALYITTYLAAQAGAPVSVVSVMDSEEEALARLDEARAYLAAHEVEVATRSGNPPAAKAILQAAQATNSDLILMGGYGYSPVLEVILGSAVDKILREGTQPVLFCR
jgi:nucleotide-binding universal stress UspA family protein